MKKFLAIVAFAATTAPAFAGTTADLNAADLNATNTKALVKFNDSYKGASGIWNNEKSYNEVLFFWNNKLMDSFYDNEGNLIGTFHDIDVKELPDHAATKIANWYKEYTVKAASVMERDDQDPTYYVTVQSDKHLRILQVNADGVISEYKTLR
ncbi:MAG TPA: hypothetical protein VL547_13765 [Dinghuibacter sp.]|uniref:hypothetical protein n=1 Tax=Dinghuibacter sp. TaxID=2024697 RepID=UPI002C528F57|nr:hypothetical protein [Dinghuibacter sp.]HTJ13095.1 hypothetical protein [Dinghuibacter sp.]